MNKALIQTERELFDFISLPEVRLACMKIIFNEEIQQIDLQFSFADGKLREKKDFHMLM